MVYREVNIKITDVTGSVTKGTISMIQSASESVKKQLIDRYCGRLSTWETSWIKTLKEGQEVVLEASDEYPWHCLAPGWNGNSMLEPLASGADESSDSASDRNHRSVSAINKVLERYNLVRKRRLH